MTLIDLPAGVYRHYKGPLYLVLGYGHDSNYEARTVIVYVGLQLDDAKPGPRLAVRTAGDFLTFVCSNDKCHNFGSALYGGSTCGYCHVAGVPRFVYVGPAVPA